LISALTDTKEDKKDMPVRKPELKREAWSLNHRHFHHKRQKDIEGFIFICGEKAE
jgi:hypothetical protein